MSNRSYFRKMYVPAAMDKLLRAFGACDGCCGVAFEDCTHEAATAMNSEQGATEHHEPPLLSTRYRKNQVVQRCSLHVLDDEQRSWPITYEVRVSSGQRHRHFTGGWAALCKGNGFCTGDKLAITIATCVDGKGDERGVTGGRGKGVEIQVRRVVQDRPEE